MTISKGKLEAIIDALVLAADMEKLEVLDLEGNKVDDLGALVYLGWCPQLAILNLADNPVAQEPNYSAQVLLHLVAAGLHHSVHFWEPSRLLTEQATRLLLLMTIGITCMTAREHTSMECCHRSTLHGPAASHSASCFVQVCAALPVLHLLDETKLDRPLSPVSKLAHPHRQTHPGTTGSDGHASSLVAIHHTSAQAILADTALHDFGLGMMPGSELSQHASSNVLLAKASVRPSRQQRPASASRLQQRLPPVAVGHNQPGSYLLYSLNQLPTKALQSTADDEMTALEHTSSAPNFRAVGGTTLHHSEALRLRKSCDRGAYDSVPDGFSSCTDVKKVRPASAGIRRADSRLQNPSASESSRYCSCFERLPA